MLKGRSFTKETDLTPVEWTYLLELSEQLKAERRSGCETQRLVGKKVALLFEKSSTRTRCAFEVAQVFRHFELDVEIAVVDRAQFDIQAFAAMFGAAVGKTGHAFDHNFLL